jgi:hypothetical protein
LKREDVENEGVRGKRTFQLGHDEYKGLEARMNLGWKIARRLCNWSMKNCRGPESLLAS